MDRRQLLNRFQFHNNFVCYNQISPKTFVKMDVTERDWNWLLADSGQTAFLQFPRQNDFIDGFQQTWTKSFVDVKSGIHNFTRNFVFSPSFQS